MMFTLSSFYRSKEWEGLLKQLRIERLNDEGQIICEYCGKPITKAYDMIGHHKIELTDANVNDFTVSLNPDNISFVHHRCHNYIHNKLGYAVREVYLVYGAPLSGKSTWVSDNMNAGDLVIDMDNIWQCISGCSRYVKPNRLKSVAFKVRDSLLDTVKYRYGKWNNAYIIGGYPLRSERERLCKELGAREVFIDADRNDCIDRLNDSDRGLMSEYVKYIDDWFAKYS
jgi:hypothetical protein